MHPSCITTPRGRRFCGADPASVEPALRDSLGQTGPFQPGQVTELEVPGLCPALGFRIFEVRFLRADGLESSSRNVFLYGRGLLRELAGHQLWGLSVDSGVMSGGALYFSYGWGSGCLAQPRQQNRRGRRPNRPAVVAPSHKRRPRWRLFVRGDQDRVRVEGGAGEDEFWNLRFNVWSDARLLGYAGSKVLGLEHRRRIGASGPRHPALNTSGPDIPPGA